MVRNVGAGPRACPHCYYRAFIHRPKIHVYGNGTLELDTGPAPAASVLTWSKRSCFGRPAGPLATRSSTRQIMRHTLSPSWAYTISALVGSTGWIAISQIIGRREAWDSELYFSWFLPSLALVVGGLAYSPPSGCGVGPSCLSARKPWRPSCKIPARISYLSGLSSSRSTVRFASCRRGRGRD